MPSSAQSPKDKTSERFLIGIMAVCIGMLAGAMIFQLVLDYPPCSVCIKVRLAVFGMLISSGIGLLVPNNGLARGVASIPLGVSFIFFAMYTLTVYKAESGALDGACSIYINYPAWLPLGQLWPSMFEPQVPCGLTPYLFLNLTMAEGLVAITVLVGLALLSYCARLLDPGAERNGIA